MVIFFTTGLVLALLVAFVVAFAVAFVVAALLGAALAFLLGAALAFLLGAIVEHVTTDFAPFFAGGSVTHLRLGLVSVDPFG